jgi:hypothetical protein
MLVRQASYPPVSYWSRGHLSRFACCLIFSIFVHAFLRSVSRFGFVRETHAGKLQQHTRHTMTQHLSIFGKPTSRKSTKLSLLMCLSPADDSGSGSCYYDTCTSNVRSKLTTASSLVGRRSKFVSPHIFKAPRSKTTCTTSWQIVRRCFTDLLLCNVFPWISLVGFDKFLNASTHRGWIVFLFLLQISLSFNINIIPFFQDFMRMTV